MKDSKNANADLIGVSYIDEGPYFKGQTVTIVSLSKAQPLTHLTAKLHDMTWDASAEEIRETLERQKNNK